MSATEIKQALDAGRAEVAKYKAERLEAQARREASDGFLICAHCGVRYHSGVAHERRCREAIETAAGDLRSLCDAIPHLTVHGVGVGDGTLYVYCRAKKNAQQRIPKEHAGYEVKYVLCSVMPGDAR